MKRLILLLLMVLTFSFLYAKYTNEEGYTYVTAMDLCLTCDKACAINSKVNSIIFRCVATTQLGHSYNYEILFKKDKTVFNKFYMFDETDYDIDSGDPIREVTYIPVIYHNKKGYLCKIHDVDSGTFVLTETTFMTRKVMIELMDMYIIAKELYYLDIDGDWVEVTDGTIKDAN